MSEQKPTYTAAETWREFYKRETGRELFTEPHPVYCCDEMRRAVHVGLVEDNQIEYFEEYLDDSEFHNFTLNYCPFCGTAVTTKQSP